MTRVKYILGSINVLNILLIGFIVFFVHVILLPFYYRSIRFDLPAIQKNTAIQSIANNIPEQAKPLSPVDYMIIAEQNLFHPERTIPRETKETQSATRPEFILYGTLVTENLKMAFLDDLKSQYSSRGRGKRQRTLKTKESLSGYMLADVFSDKVVMVKGDERIIVTISDPSKPKRTVKEQPTQKQAKEGLENTSPQKAASAESFPSSNRDLFEMEKKNKRKNR